MKIAVDAMGGDYGPAVVVEGAVAASREFGVTVALVGDRAAIEREVARLGTESGSVEIRHASQVVGMAESPSQALRRKRRTHYKLAAPTHSVCPQCREPKLPHRVCPHCGYYKGREIVAVEGT